MDKFKIPQKSDSAQRDQALCRRLLPVIGEGAKSDDRKVARLALDVIIRAVVEHLETAA